MFEPDPDTATILWNELDPVVLKDLLYFQKRFGAKLFSSLEPLYRIRRHVGRRSQIKKSPSKRNTSESALN